jgi:hypothetical protein
MTKFTEFRRGVFDGINKIYRIGGRPVLDRGDMRVIK